MTDDEREYELVMPFVAVTSQGGPYDDLAYAAGWEMGVIDVFLQVLPESQHGHRVHIREGNLPQADLVAMKRGWVVTHSEPEDGWVLVTFIRGTELPVSEPGS